jgi:hypothetical protein
MLKKLLVSLLMVNNPASKLIASLFFTLILVASSKVSVKLYLRYSSPNLPAAISSAEFFIKII